MFVDKDGKRINIHAAFIADAGTSKEVTYPNLLDPTIRESLGIKEIADPERPDENYYFVNEIDEAPYVMVTEKPLEMLKDIKLVEISASFAEEMKSGKMSSSLGFTVDNRRYADKFDRDNVQGLIDIGASPVDFKDSNGDPHTLSLAQLQILKTEMIADGLAKYQKKWSLQSAVSLATSINELKAITW